MAVVIVIFTLAFCWLFGPENYWPFVFWLVEFFFTIGIWIVLAIIILVIIAPCDTIFPYFKRKLSKRASK